MLKTLFKKLTPEDVIKELRTQKSNKISNTLEKIDIHYKNDLGRNFLHYASEANNVNAIKILIKMGIKPDITDDLGFTPLMAAANGDATDAIETLLSLKANAQITNDYGRNALFESVLNNKTAAFLILKSNTNDIYATDTEGNNILYEAIKTHNEAIINYLLNSKKIDNNKLFDTKEPLLHQEAVYLNSALTTKLLKSGIDPTNCDHNGKNAIFYAIRGGFKNIESIQTMLNCGLDINSVDKKGNNALFELINIILSCEDDDTQEYIEKQKDYLKLIEFLLEEDIDKNALNKSSKSYLDVAVKSKNLNLIKILLAHNIDPSISNDASGTILHQIILDGIDSLQMILLLIEYDVDVNIKNENDQTIIELLIDAELSLVNDKKVKPSFKRMLKEDGKYHKVLEEVLANGNVNLNLLNSNNEPYFFDTVILGNIELFRLLTHYGCDINQVDENGLNILYKYIGVNKNIKKEADKVEYFNTLKNIISFGANVNSRDSYGGITLHKAVLDNDIQTVKTLLRYGADIKAIDNQGRNMVHNSVWKNKIKIFRLIYTLDKTLLNKTDKYGVLPIHYAAFLGYDDLVLEFITLGSYINSPSRKSNHIIKFLERFHKNISPLIESARNVSDKSKIISLVKNMKTEFEIGGLSN